MSGFIRHLDDSAIEVLRTPEEQKKYAFMEAYIEWTKAEGHEAKDLAWVKYCTARDRYLNLCFDPFRF